MTKASKYLNLFVLLALLVGQLQFVRTTYFCTEQLRTVNMPSAEMHSSEPMSDNETCDECQGFIPSYHGQTLSSTNCIQVHILTKSAVSNFAITDKSISNPAGTVWTRKMSSVSYRPSAISCTLTNRDSSPPSDIPIANSNLRI